MRKLQGGVEKICRFRRDQIVLPQMEHFSLKLKISPEKKQKGMKREN